jgi:DNA polymerase III epsilon subunit-like protein
MFFAYKGRLTPPLLVAHNGASFDHSIMRAHATRLQLPQFDRECMKDSLRPARQMMPHLRSHSLGNLHKKLIREPFQAHHALSDALALYRVCHALARRENVMVADLWSTTRGSLTSLPGIGPKTARALRAADYNLQKLKEVVQTHETCPEALKTCIRNHRSLWRKLRNNWVVSKLDIGAAEVTAEHPRVPRRTERKPRRSTVSSRHRRSKSV